MRSQPAGLQGSRSWPLIVPPLLCLPFVLSSVCPCFTCFPCCLCCLLCLPLLPLSSPLFSLVALVLSFVASTIFRCCLCCLLSFACLLYFLFSSNLMFLEGLSTHNWFAFAAFFVYHWSLCLLI